MMAKLGAGIRNLRTKSWRWWLPLLLIALLYPAIALNLDDRLLFALKGAWQDNDVAGLFLSEYRVRVDALPVDGVADDLSGLAFDEKRGHLWAVVNSPPELLALSREGRVLARHPLKGFKDVEGIAYLGDDLLVLAEERSNTLVVVPVPEAPGAVDRAGREAFALGSGHEGNQSFEGVGYDRRGDRLFVVKEHTPRKLYEIRGFKASLNGTLNLEVIDREDWIRSEAFPGDLASVDYDQRTGHLLLLSQESRLIVELDAEGRLVSLHALDKGFGGMGRRVKQAEGLALDDRGDLYVVGEPNLFYAFSRE